MEYFMGGHGGFGGDQGESSSGNEKRLYNRHSPNKIERLEEFFKVCPNPNESQRCELAREVGLEPRQIKFWFQNKRTQTKTHNERVDNESLRERNERLRCENLYLRETLKKVRCRSCDCSPNAGGDSAHIVQYLKFENNKMKEKYDKIAAFLTQQSGKPFPKWEYVALPDTSMNVPLTTFQTNQTNGSIIDPDHALGAPLQFFGFTDLEKANMRETSKCAMSELIRLLEVNEPLWIKSSITQKYVIDNGTYETLFPQENHLSNARVESSKEFTFVPMSAVQLVDMFFDAEKYEALFSTIIKQASKICILDNGLPDSHDGRKQLMYLNIYSLSPLVESRKFHFLRSCQELAQGVWVVGDVSYDIPNWSTSSSMSWRRPSGCLIQEIQNNYSKVTWVEHVEVDNGQTHSLHLDIVNGELVYGATRWVAILKRMCERINASKRNNTTTNEGGGIYCRGIMQLSYKMIKEFCSMLYMPGSINSLPLPGTTNGSFKMNFQMNNGHNQPNGMVITVVASFGLPIASDKIFKFLSDENTRHQWDVLSGGNPVQRVAHVSSGSDPRNCISILQYSPLTEGSLITLQETCVDALGSIIAYAPIDYSIFRTAIRGNPSTLKIFPSGFVICPEGYLDSIARASTSRDTSMPCGSLVSLAFQMLVASQSPRQCNAESLGILNNIISTTMQKLMVALNYPE